ncbi:hypothetical protein ZIOFF_062774 [Zingiber officinale]|uniref:PDZ domain-containing protein n=1 Tax=Zingiber officinale TaxID=94328 RepID=A0A8J5F5A2_ZINOF|nr:hypothetical protein ZIOFF_062774 [Zingiber officinale]
MEIVRSQRESTHAAASTTSAKLSFYRSAPALEVRLEDFELYGIDRLRVLQGISDGLPRGKRHEEMERLVLRRSLMSEFQLPYKAISHAEFETVKEKLNQVAHSIGQPLNADTLFFKAPFEEVPELFVGCRVFLKKVLLMLRCIRCAAVDSSGNAAKAGLRAGDQVLYTSSFFGDELWPVDKLGFTKTVIQAKPDSVYFVVNREAEVDVKRLTKRPAPPRFCCTLTEAQKEIILPRHGWDAHTVPAVALGHKGRSALLGAVAGGKRRGDGSAAVLGQGAKAQDVPLH